jgi:hypothetical protein
MKKLMVAAVAAAAMAFAGTAAAALVPGVFDPGNTKCPVATYSHGVLHLEKNCATSTNASAGADITGLDGQTFTSASFTLASTTQCQGGSPRFNIFTTTGTFFLGCNNVTPVVNADGTATYTFTAATIAAGGNQVPVPTGTITSAEVLIDVQGTADLKHHGQRHEGSTRRAEDDEVQEGRVEALDEPEVQEPGPVHQVLQPSAARGLEAASSRAPLIVEL